PAGPAAELGRSPREVFRVERVSRRELTFATTDVGPDGNWLHDGRPFTGVAYTLAPDGSVRSEATFRDGLQWGPVWDRFRSGALYYEATFFGACCTAASGSGERTGSWRRKGNTNTASPCGRRSGPRPASWSRITACASPTRRSGDCSS